MAIIFMKDTMENIHHEIEGNTLMFGALEILVPSKIVAKYFVRNKIETGRKTMISPKNVEDIYYDFHRISRCCRCHKYLLY